MTNLSDQRYGSETFAQHGDDLFILALFDTIGIQRPSYLDIGAHHPSQISNTKLLYNRGCRGVNVEANPNLYEAFLLERPEDVNVSIGVGPKAGKMPFFMHGPTAGRNTFSESERDQWVLEGHPVTNTLMLEVMTIDQVVRKYCPDSIWPDLLSIDAEGLDYEIMATATMNVTYPKIVCVETRRSQNQDMFDILALRGFNPLVRLGENLFFVHKRYPVL